MSKPGFNWVTPVLCVNDLVKSLVHYEEVLGFDVAWKWSATETFEEPSHPTFACVSRGECHVFLCEQGQGSPGSWICLNVNTREELELLFHKERSRYCRGPIGSFMGYVRDDRERY